MLDVISQIAEIEVLEKLENSHKQLQQQRLEEACKKYLNISNKVSEVGIESFKELVDLLTKNNVRDK